MTASRFAERRLSSWAGGANSREILALAPWVQASGVPAMNLKPISSTEQWMHPEDEAARLREKELLLADGAEIHACLPEAAAAAKEAAEYAAGCSDLLTAGMRVPEDLLVMAPRPSGEYHLVAGSLAAPSYWQLHEKLGLPLSSIHQPVPELESRIGGRIKTFFARMPEERIFLRSNWFLHPSKRLYQPDREEIWPEASAETPGETLFLRCERQTLCRLPGTKAILFTVLPLTAPVACIKGGPLAGELLAALAGLHPSLRKERQVALYEAGLTRFLSSS